MRTNIKGRLHCTTCIGKPHQAVLDGLDGKALKAKWRDMVFSLNQTNLGYKERIQSFSHAILLLTEICKILILFSQFIVFSMYADTVESSHATVPLRSVSKPELASCYSPFGKSGNF